MIELLRTNDIVLLSVIEAILTSERVDFFLADQHMSTLEGSTGFMQRRILVPIDVVERARRLMREAGFGAELADR
ncbi:DUF2007 domain-containing protein [Lichenihabitans sp. Uapishka_5]|uniref:putative signal transducing protein n=1 Tax=Lichenihabitans sp. Uapishka_5 TaxID=3037302 RepID=UPI0029E81111|nr:DUF2007 domain-containing protein [Lichenihabitans sp. Uapishka_5]MDX7949632.1 DUF2007 domain-containing protein [Lichenihabitans sp. Uapishka_5]